MLKELLEVGGSIAKASKTKSIADIGKATSKSLKAVKKLATSSKPKKEKKCSERKMQAGSCKANSRRNVHEQH